MTGKTICRNSRAPESKRKTLQGNGGEIKTILRNARDSGDQTAIHIHEDVQDALLRKNQLQFMDIEVKKSS